MASKKKLKKWTAVYPQGTREGDEEQRFFIALGRHPKYKWRSTSAISKEANLTKERVEEIIQKYYKSGMVVQNPQNEDQWGYWERLDQPDDDDDCGKTVVEKDHDKRIKKVLNPSGSGSCGSGGCSGGSCGSKKASKASPSMSTPLFSGPNIIADANDVGRALSYVTGDSKWEKALQPFDFNETITSIPPQGIQLPSVQGSWIVCEKPVADIHEPAFAGFAPSHQEVVAAQQWDFQTALGDTIREKYENEYIKVVEVSNINSREVKSQTWLSTDVMHQDVVAEERAWACDI